MNQTLKNSLRRVKRFFLNRFYFFIHQMPNQPISEDFGSRRGAPIDRYYIESFLNENRQLITGNVLEVGESAYTQQYGHQVTSAVALKYEAVGNSKTEIRGDLNVPAQFSENQFDCFICTQTFQYLKTPDRGIESAYRLLKKGGVFLATFPCVSQKSTGGDDSWKDFWRFSSNSVYELLSRYFLVDQIEVRAHGNVKTCSAFLYGFGQDDVSKKCLDEFDPDYELIITARAKKV